MKKYFIYGIGLALTLGGLVAAVNVHDHNVFMAGYDKRDAEQTELDKLALISAAQNSELQRMGDAKAAQHAALERDKRLEHFTEIAHEVAEHDRANPDQYPDHWRLTDTDLELYNRTVKTATGAGEQLGADTRAFVAGASGGCGAVDDGAYSGTEGPGPDTLKTVQRPCGEAQRAGGCSAPPAADADRYNDKHNRLKAT